MPRTGPPEGGTLNHKTADSNSQLAAGSQKLAARSWQLDFRYPNAAMLRRCYAAMLLCCLLVAGRWKMGDGR